VAENWWGPTCAAGKATPKTFFQPAPAQLGFIRSQGYSPVVSLHGALARLHVQNLAAPLRRTRPSICLCPSIDWLVASRCRPRHPCLSSQIPAYRFISAGAKLRLAAQEGGEPERYAKKKN